MTKSSLARVQARPDPAQWKDDELLTLGEAAALYWPGGPLTERSLRTAVRDGRLPISQIAGKFFVTKAALRCRTLCEPLAGAPPASEAESRSPGGGYLEDLRAIKEMRHKPAG